MLTATRSHQGSSTLHTSASGDVPQPLQAAEYTFQCTLRTSAAMTHCQA